MSLSIDKGRKSKLLSLLAGALVAAYAATPVYAFTPFQAPLLSTAAVTPNVMLLLDNSGSMNTVIYHSGFNSRTDYPTAMYCKAGTSCNVTNRDHWADTATLSGHSNVAQGGCASGYYRLGAKNRYRVSGQDRYYPGTSAQTVCIPFPGVVQTNSSGSTADEADLPKNYLEYLVQGVLAGTVIAADIPTTHRMGVAKSVAKQIVADNFSGVRFGLATFRPGNTASGSTGEVYQQQGGIIQSGLGATKATLDANVNALYGATYTPLAEAYYDVIRYYRGLASSYNAAPANISDQVQYRCQKNFGIVVTDGAPTYDSKFFNAASDPDRDNPAVAGTDNLPNWDGLNPSPPTAYSDGDSSLSLSSEGSTYYLDDIAKFAYDIDIRPTAVLDNAGKSFEATAFNQQNVKTYTVGFAQDNQMLKDAAFYGRGKYYTATDSAGLTAALTQALNEISAQAGSGGAGASSSTSLTTETRYYKTLYDPADWRGTVEAYSLSPTTGRLLARVWSTDNTITPSNNGASYQTYNTGTNSVVSLAYANVSATQQATLSAGLPSGVTGSQLVDWAKGAAVTGLRTRTVLLGDVINSTLERVSSTERLASDITGSTSYDSFIAAKAGMTNSLLVNSNDGFFHVINADTGGHRYGYMPSSVFPQLKTVAATDYATSGGHKFMVDGGITVADAEVNSTWSTVAVAGMGGGGKSMFAVKLFSAGDNTIRALWEVTAPATSTPANVWNNLGYTYSKPLVVRNASNQWVAIFGNGYGSHLGKASLYVVNLSTGQLIQELVVDANATGTTPNGLSSPQMVVNAQYQVQKVYAGDLRGNLWEIDMSSGSASVANGGTPLFAAGSDHPITAKPLVIEHEDKGGHMVLFGTGKLMEAADKLSTELQTFYAIWDKPSSTGTVSSSSLQAQAFVDDVDITADGVTQTYYTTTENTVDWDTKRGWYLPLVLDGDLEGERVIYPAQTTLGRVIFVTAKVDAVDPCESTGSGKLVELDAISGSMLTYPVLDTNGDGKVDDGDTRVSGLGIEDGLPGVPVIIDAGDEKDTQGKYILKSTGEVQVVDECGEVNNGQCGGVAQSRRIMWRQLQ
ncbi:PilC/PilY family type IV pilus protein [Pseudomonas sp. SO81]|uniref:pilus assembly protein n=1 Tax=Pseudomonas sp. SO81 TaxID=2983246 RepID=UPI0025A415E4|nr:PilC/PilY family type IV pilus protein [Pseudomonas sp. SO81]